MSFGGLLGGDQSQTTTSDHTVTFPKWIDPEMREFFKNSLSKTMDLANTPYEAYGGQRLADFSPDELASFDLVRNLTGQSGADVAEAQGITRQVANRGLNGATAEQLQGYTNPYQQQVMDISKGRQLDEFSRQRNALMQQAGQTGAFGGSRNAIAQGNLYDQFARNLSENETNQLYQGYNDAYNRFNQGNQLAGQSAQNLAQMAQMAQGVGLQNAGALSAQGQQQRGLEQQGLDINYQNWAQEKQYPYQQLQFQESMGLPLGQTLAGSHDVATTTTSGGSGLLGTALGIGSMLMGMPPIGAMGSTLGGSMLGGLGSMFSGLGGGGSSFAGAAMTGPYAGGWAFRNGGPVTGFKDGGCVTGFDEGGHVPFAGMVGGLNLPAAAPATPTANPSTMFQQWVMPQFTNQRANRGIKHSNFLLANPGATTRDWHDFRHAYGQSLLHPATAAPTPISNVGGHMPFLGLAGINQFPQQAQMRSGGLVTGFSHGGPVFHKTGDGQHEYGGYACGGLVGYKDGGQVKDNRFDWANMSGTDQSILQSTLQALISQDPPKDPTNLPVYEGLTPMELLASIASFGFRKPVYDRSVRKEEGSYGPGFQRGGCVTSFNQGGQIPGFSEGGVNAGTYYPSIGGMPPEDFWAAQQAAQPEDTSSGWLDNLWSDTIGAAKESTIGKGLQYADQKLGQFAQSQGHKDIQDLMYSPRGLALTAMLAPEIAPLLGAGAKGVEGAVGLAGGAAKLAMNSPKLTRAARLLGAASLLAPSGMSMPSLSSSKVAAGADPMQEWKNAVAGNQAAGLTSDANGLDNPALHLPGANAGANDALDAWQNRKDLHPAVKTALKGMGLAGPSDTDTTVSTDAATPTNTDVTDKANYNAPLIAFGAALLGSHNSFFKALGEAGQKYVTTKEDKEDRIAKLAQQAIENKIAQRRLEAYETQNAIASAMLPYRQQLAQSQIQEKINKAKQDPNVIKALQIKVNAGEGTDEDIAVLDGIIKGSGAVPATTGNAGWGIKPLQ